MRKITLVRVGLTMLVLFVALFPNPRLTLRQLQSYIRGPEYLVEPNHPGLASYEKDVRSMMRAGIHPEAAIQATVNRRIKYTSDLRNWGQLDYWPTVEETLARGREDCDGRAIVAASLARRMGITNCTLRMRIDHMWLTFGKPSNSPEIKAAFVAGPYSSAEAVTEFSQLLREDAGVYRLCIPGLLLVCLWSIRPGAKQASPLRVFQVCGYLRKMDA